MDRAFFVSAGVIGAIVGALALAVPEGTAQREAAVTSSEDAQADLKRALEEGKRAEVRAARFDKEAEAAGEAAEKTVREMAALAARIQRAEADIVAARARYSIAQKDRSELAARLANRQQPLVRLTSALQTSSRRPLALSALQPGSLKDLVYVRAVLDSAVPRIRERTAGLRSELELGRKLEQDAKRALAALRKSEDDLIERRAALARLENQQRLALRDARGAALREGERALALAEDARDLDGLIDRIDENAALRRELAALSGPLVRPATLAEPDIRGLGSASSNSETRADSSTQATTSSPPSDFQLPVQGRTLTGFGEMLDSGLRSTGLSLSPSPAAQIVAPATGRVAFSGPYRGYGRIVIIEHDGGWTSLVTGLERVSVEVGESVIGGGPLGLAGREDPVITVELRRGGDPVNPLRYLR